MIMHIARDTFHKTPGQHFNHMTIGAAAKNETKGDDSHVVQDAIAGAEKP